MFLLLLVWFCWESCLPLKTNTCGFGSSGIPPWMTFIARTGQVKCSCNACWSIFFQHFLFCGWVSSSSFWPQLLVQLGIFLFCVPKIWGNTEMFWTDRQERPSVGQCKILQDSVMCMVKIQKGLADTLTHLERVRVTAGFCVFCRMLQGFCRIMRDTARQTAGRSPASIRTYRVASSRVFAQESISISAKASSLVGIRGISKAHNSAVCISLVWKGGTRMSSDQSQTFSAALCLNGLSGEWLFSSQSK